MTMWSGIENVYKLPLQDIALRKVATLLCSQPKVYMFVLGIKGESEMELQTPINRVSKDILGELVLPVSTKKELANLMTPLISELIKWHHFHRHFLYYTAENLSSLNVLEHICWEPFDMVTISYRETAEALIRHEKLDIFQRYKLACLYCLEPYVRDLWNELPEYTKDHVYNSRISPNEKRVIFIFWACKLDRRLNDLYDIIYCLGNSHFSIYQYAFECAAVLGYRTATQYFFEKLTSREKEVSLVKTACAVASERSSEDCTYYLHEYHKFSDVFCYLITLMTEEQVMEVIQIQPCATLLCFLDWPRQDAFLEFATRTFPYLSDTHYSRLLFTLVKNISLRYNYSKLFREFFLISPMQRKNYTLITSAHFLNELCIIGDEENIKFIFKNLQAVDKVKLALSDTGMYISYDLMKEGDWKLLDIFYREVKLSKEETERYYESFSFLHGISISKMLKKRRKWAWFRKLMKEASPDTSKCDKETSLPCVKMLERPTPSTKKQKKV